MNDSIAVQQTARHPGKSFNPAQIRLGWISGRWVHVAGGELYADSGVGRVVDELGRHFREITVAMSVTGQRLPLQDHLLNVSTMRFVPLPTMLTTGRGFAKVGACLRAIRQVEAASDVVICQLPFTAPLALLGGTKPRVYHVCSDVWQTVASSRAYVGPKRAVALSAARAVVALQQYLVKRPNVRVVTNGEALLQTLRGALGTWAVSSCLHRSDIGAYRRARPPEASPRILFVGYLRPEKGIDVLLSAYAQILAKLPHAELHVVGPSKPSGITPDIAELLARARVRGRVVFSGPKAFGPTLFQCFADADLLVLPSRSEGTPRVLLEARAMGCPVVATRVGGIPSSVAHNRDGLLVPPGEIAPLTAAIERMLSDTALRARLVQGGLQRARHCTVERFCAQLLRQVELALENADLNKPVLATG